MPLNQTEQKAAKPVNTYKQRGWPDTAYQLGALIISKNLLLPAGALALLLLFVYRLSSGDLRGLVETIIEKKWFAVSGWVMSVICVFSSIKLFKWQARIYREQIEELKKLKGNGQELLKLESESDKPKP